MIGHTPTDIHVWRSNFTWKWINI